MGLVAVRVTSRLRHPDKRDAVWLSQRVERGGCATARLGRTPKLRPCDAAVGSAAGRGRALRASSLLVRRGCVVVVLLSTHAVPFGDHPSLNSRM